MYVSRLGMQFYCVLRTPWPALLLLTSHVLATSTYVRVRVRVREMVARAILFAGENKVARPRATFFAGQIRSLDHARPYFPGLDFCYGIRFFYRGSCGFLCEREIQRMTTEGTPALIMTLCQDIYLVWQLTGVTMPSCQVVEQSLKFPPTSAASCSGLRTCRKSGDETA